MQHNRRRLNSENKQLGSFCFYVLAMKTMTSETACSSAPASTYGDQTGFWRNKKGRRRDGVGDRKECRGIYSNFSFSKGCVETWGEGGEGGLAKSKKH